MIEHAGEPKRADGVQQRRTYLRWWRIDERIAAPIAATVLAVIFEYALVAHLSAPAMNSDWDFSTQLQWVAYHSVRRFHQLPLWNPYKCGGMPLLGNPQSHFLSPWFALTLMFGPIVGLHLEVVGHFIVAWLGTYALGRVLAMRPLAAAAAACAFATSSWFNLRVSEGHVVFLPIAYAPAIVALAIAGSERRGLSAEIGAAALLALTFFEGGFYPPVFVATALSIVMLILCATRVSLRPLLSLTVVGLFAAGFAAIKAVPSYDLIAIVPRPTSAYYNEWELIRTALFSHDQDRMRVSPNFWGFHESGAYLGVFVIPAVVALLRPRRALPWIVLAVLMVLLARGEHGPTWLWPLLHQLPVGSSMRLPSRFLMLVALAVAVLAGIGLDVLLDRGWRYAPSIALMLLAVGLADNFIVSTPNLKYALGNQVAPNPPQETFRQYQLHGWSGNMYRTTRQNQGILDCYEYTEWHTAAIGADQAGYRGEQFIEPAGSVTLNEWTPNRLMLEVKAPAPAIVTINQNWDPGWRLTKGAGEVFANHGLIGIKVPRLDQELILSYEGAGFAWGAATTILTTLAAFLVLGMSRRPRT